VETKKRSLKAALTETVPAKIALTEPLQAEGNSMEPKQKMRGFSRRLAGSRQRLKSPTKAGTTEAARRKGRGRSMGSKKVRTISTDED
jgi:hypothetical protein